MVVSGLFNFDYLVFVVNIEGYFFMGVVEVFGDNGVGDFEFLVGSLFLVMMVVGQVGI